jgi:hypothetical protein
MRNAPQYLGARRRFAWRIGVFMMMRGAGIGRRGMSIKARGAGYAQVHDAREVVFCC